MTAPTPETTGGKTGDRRLVHGVDSGRRTYAVFNHLVFLLVPIPVLPALVMWLIRKDDSPFLDDHGREAVNFQISLALIAAVAGLLVVVGIAPKGKAPTFLVSALKDGNGANLDRIQIVKGWLDADGELHEKVYDVAVSDGRKIAKGKVKKAVGSTVDLSTATYTNTIGDAQLTAGWTDPDFDASVRSFYYTRVIEIPTPRWTAFDEVRFGIKMDAEATRVLQERAYTSPIWYTP